MKNTAETTRRLHLRKRAACLLLTLCMLLTLHAAAFAEQGGEESANANQWEEYSFEILGGNEIKITAYSGTSHKKVKIPDTILGYRVTALGNHIFKGYHVVNVGSEVPSSLERVEIPDSVRTIDGNPFSGCPHLTEIIVFPTNPNLSVIDNVLFCKADKSIVCYPQAKAETEYVIPEGVQVIGRDAFCGCSALKQVTVPDGVKTIGEDAFASCSRLMRIELPDSVVSIGDGAFAGCVCLGKVSLSSRLESIGEAAFLDCKRLSGIELPDGLKEIGDVAFAGCSALNRITIPGSIKAIGDSPFRECTRMTPTSILIMNNRFSVENGMLFDTLEHRLIQVLNKRVSKAEIPQGTKIIGKYAFYNVTNMAGITIPDTVTEIRSSAFSGCRSLKAVEIPDGVRTIEPRTFSGCAGLTELKLPKELREIRENAFSGCKSLETVTIPEGVTVLGSAAFSDCAKLRTVSVPGSVSSIEDDVFCRCDKLSSVLVKKGSYAEDYCKNGKLPFAYSDSLDWLNG